MAAKLLPGVWQVWPGVSDAQLGATSWIQGGQVTLDWATVQPRYTGTVASPVASDFAWASLDTRLQAFAAMGKPCSVQVNSDRKPGWVYDHIARYYPDAASATGVGWDVPQYWDPIYLARAGQGSIYEYLLVNLHAHLMASPYRDTVALIRHSPNLIGTEHTSEVPTPQTTGYRFVPASNGHSLPAGGFSNSVMWAAYHLTTELYISAFGPDFPVALRSKEYSGDPNAVPAELSGTGGRWLLGTNSNPDGWGPDDAYTYQQSRIAQKTRTYWEQQSTTGHGTVNNVVSWNLERMCFELHKGTSFVATYGNELKRGLTQATGDAPTAEYVAAFAFANRYADRHFSPSTAPGAWVYFRHAGTGVLDADLTFLSSWTNSGCAYLDSLGGTVNPGTAPIGPATSRYCRYALSMGAGGTATGTLDPIFKAALSGQVAVNVTYLDDWVGSLSVSAFGAAAQTITMGNTGVWVTATKSFPAGTGGPDIALTSNQAATKVAMVELTGTTGGGAGGATAPGAPTIGTASSGGSGAVLVTWTPAASNGGSAVTSYLVTPYIGTAAQPAVSVTVGSSATLTGLTNGTAYTFTVKAVNAIGTGPASAASNAVTPSAAASAPAIPTGVVTTPTNGGATVTWTAPANGGSPITSYYVMPVDATGTEVTASAATVAGTPPATAATITGLTNGTTYNGVKVWATNAVGTSAYSTFGSGPFTPSAAASAPAAPTAVQVVPGATSATVTWTAPANGGSVVTGYTVTPYVGTTAGTPVPAAAGATSATVTGLLAGTTYTLAVKAVNAIGTGPAGVSSPFLVGAGPLLRYTFAPGDVAGATVADHGRANLPATFTAGSGTPTGSVRTNTPATTSPGHDGTAAALNFSRPAMQALAVPYSAALNVAAYTIAAWVYIAEADSPENAWEVMERAAGIWLNVQTGHSPPGASHALRTGGFFGGAANINYHYVDSLNLVTSSTWHHCAGTYDGATLSVYLDGALEASIGVTGAPNYPVGEAQTVGAKVAPTKGLYMNWHQGRIEDYRFYDRALSAAEINAIGGGGTPPSVPTAAVTATPASGPAPTTVAFDGSGSVSGTSPLVSYAMDYRDGATAAAQGTPAFSHAYAAVGTYSAVLTVTAADGSTGTASVLVTITAAHTPTASLLVTPDTGGAPLTVTIDATGSHTN